MCDYRFLLSLDLPCPPLDPSSTIRSPWLPSSPGVPCRTGPAFLSQIALLSFQTSELLLAYLSVPASSLRTPWKQTSFLPVHHRGTSINTEKLCWYAKVRYGRQLGSKLRLKSKQYTKSFSSKIKLLLGKNSFQPSKQRHNDDTKTLNISKVVVKTLFYPILFLEFSLLQY